MSDSEAVHRVVSEAVERYGLRAELVDQLVALAEAALRAEISSGTSISDPVEAARVHVADSLSVFETGWLDGCRRLIDIGSGLGFPGLAIAAARPEIEVVLLDAARKKSQAAARIARECAVADAVAMWGRAEEVAEVGSPHRAVFDIVTARALAPLVVLAEYAAPLLREGGALVAWKGAPGNEEVAAAVTGCEQLGLALDRPRDVEAFAGAGRRTLWRARKLSATPERFPRRPGVAARSPLA